MWVWGRVGGLGFAVNEGANSSSGLDNARYASERERGVKKAKWLGVVDARVTKAATGGRRPGVGGRWRVWSTCKAEFCKTPGRGTVVWLPRCRKILSPLHKIMRHLRHPRFFEVEEFSDYREPNYVSPMVVALAVLVTALVVFCLCKKGMGSKGGCGACASAKAAHNTSASSGGVVEATDSRHLEELLQTDGCVCLFWAPWCGHCAHMKPDYIEAAKSQTDVLFVMCDCENAVSSDTLEKHKVSAFPTIRYYKGGRMVEEYNGSRDKTSIQTWAASQKS